MAKQAQRDMREYHIFTEPLTTSTGATIAYLPVPASGQIVKITAVESTAHTVGDTVITFELGTVAGSASLTIPFASSAIGRSHVIDLDPTAGLNLALEADTSDLLAAGAVIEVISDGGCTAGAARFCFTIRP